MPPRSVDTPQPTFELDAIHDALEAIVPTLPTTGAVVLLCPFDALASQAGRYLGERLCPDTSTLDVHVVSPAGTTWTMEEVDQGLCAPASLAPLDKHVVVVSAADALSVQGADRLLKIIEEPPAPTLWLLCAKDVEDLPITLRSRVLRVVELTPPPPPSVLAALQGLSMNDHDVAHAFASVLDLLQKLASTTAFSAEVAALHDLEQELTPIAAHKLSDAVSKASKEASLSTQESRRHTAAALDAVCSSLRVRGRKALLQGHDPSLVLELDAACERAASAVRRFAPLPTQLAALVLHARRALS